MSTPVDDAILAFLPNSLFMTYYLSQVSPNTNMKDLMEKHSSTSGHLKIWDANHLCLLSNKHSSLDDHWCFKRASKAVVSPRFNFPIDIILNITNHNFQFYLLNLNLNFVFWKQEMNIGDNGDNLFNYCNMLLLPLIRSVLPSTIWYFSPECTSWYFSNFLIR